MSQLRHWRFRPFCALFQLRSRFSTSFLVQSRRFERQKTWVVLEIPKPLKFLQNLVPVKSYSIFCERFFRFFLTFCLEILFLKVAPFRHGFPAVMSVLSFSLENIFSKKTPPQNVSQSRSRAFARFGGGLKQKQLMFDLKNKQAKFSEIDLKFGSSTSRRFVCGAIWGGKSPHVQRGWSEVFAQQ